MAYQDAMLDAPLVMKKNKKKSNKQIIAESRALMKQNNVTDEDDIFTPTYATYGWNMTVPK